LIVWKTGEVVLTSDTSNRSTCSRNEVLFDVFGEWLELFVVCEWFDELQRWGEDSTDEKVCKRYMIWTKFI
jgi:hypothetical protein